MGDDLIAAIATCRKLMPYLHLPVQAVPTRSCGDEPQAWRRDYFDLVNGSASARPDIALSSDFIVGFWRRNRCRLRGYDAPGAREVRFAGPFSFMRTPKRPERRARNFGPDAEKSRRKGCTNCRRNSNVRRTVQCFLRGARLPVLFEKPGRHAGQIVGRTPYMQSVLVMGPASLIGTIQAVAIEQQGRIH